MHIDSTTVGAVAVFSLQGNLDTATSAGALATVEAAIAGGAMKVLFDCARLDYISSAGLRVFLVTAKKLQAKGGSLRICTLNDTVREVFEISGFVTILKVFPTRDAALEGF